MAEITPRTETALALTARWLIAIAAAGLIASAYACAAKNVPAKGSPTGGAPSTVAPTGEEPPIRVRNGSMDVELRTAEWNADGDAWTPSTGKGSGRFLVKVESATGYSCKAGQTGSGKEVWISYSDNTEVTFKSEGSSGRTKVRPKDKLAKVSTEVLRYGQQKVGYITGVGVKDGANTWSCAFKSAAELSVINICSTSNAACR